MTSYILTLTAFLLIGGSLGDRFGRRRVYLIAIVWFAPGLGGVRARPCIVGTGLAMLTFSTSGSNYLTHVLPAVAVFGFGLAITVAPLTATAMSSAPERHAGITGPAYLHPDAFAAGFRTAALSRAGCARPARRGHHQ